MNKLDTVKILGKDSIQHLWRDEVGDIFIITPKMEIYLWGKTTLGCYVWSKKTSVLLQKTRVNFEDIRTDDDIHFFKTNVENLPLLFSLGKFKRRPDFNGKRLKNLEKKLGHRILPLTYEQKRAMRQIFRPRKRVNHG